MGEGKINLRTEAVYFVDDEFLKHSPDFTSLEEGQNNSSYAFFHLGPKISGHPTIIHGGLLATLLDELTCRLAFQNFHSRKGVTAYLNTSYKKPCYVNSYVMVKCTVLKKAGRKCVVKGQVFGIDLDDVDELEAGGLLLTECECLVIEPKWVHELKGNADAP